MHLQPAVVKCYGDQEPQPVSEDLFAKGLCLPIHHEISYDDIKKICDVIKKVYDEK